MKNLEVARILYEIADILELQDVKFKPAAYRRAARNIENLPEDIEEVYKNGKLENIPGVGKNISKKIAEYLKTGKLKYYEKLKKKSPAHIEELLNISGIGPKLAKRLYKELKIKNIEDLKKAIKEHKLEKLERMGTKAEENILRGIENVQTKRMLLGLALPTALEIEKRLNNLKEVETASLAGSIARRKETIGDIDILVCSTKPEIVMNFFTKMSDVKNILASGETKSSVVLKNGIQIDLRIVPRSSYGSALQYFIGSKEHNIKLRQIALKKGYKLNEYGLFRKKDNKKVAGYRQEDIYRKLGLSYIEPEMRENRGEIECAQKHKLPKLIKYGSLKGDLHMHTKWSDGSATIEKMAEAAKKLGYEYIAITDHVGLSVARAMDEKRLKRQISEIRKIDKKTGGIKILAGAEIDIKPDGSLALSRQMLKQLDIRIGAIHSRFKSSKSEMTQRIVRALSSGYIDILAHPTGRLIQKRNPYDVDLDKIFQTAKDNKVVMEINSMPERLDLNDINIKKALEFKLKFSINTDSHNAENLHFAELGIATARRGWAQAKDVVNTRNLSGLKKFFTHSFKY